MDHKHMLLLTYSYVVPKEKRTEHARLLHRMRQVMARMGCDSFEAYEQVGKQWVGGEATGRVVQILKFRDRQHFADVQAAEKTDPNAQKLIAEFCELINLPYQQQTGMFADGFYNSLVEATPARIPPAMMTGSAKPQAGIEEITGEATPPPIEQVEETHLENPDSGSARMESEQSEAPATDASRDVNGESDVLDYLTDAAQSEPGSAGRADEDDRSRGG
jgi:hypothetical protein